MERSLQLTDLRNKDDLYPRDQKKNTDTCSWMMQYVFEATVQLSNIYIWVLSSGLIEQDIKIQVFLKLQGT